MHKIKSRLDRIYAALGDVIDPELAFRKETRTVTNRGIELKVDFTHSPQSETLINRIYNVIDGIAPLKDYYNKWRILQGGTGYRPGDELIQRSMSAALIHDLWNGDKHDGLDKSPRSGKEVTILNPRCSVATSDDSLAVVCVIDTHTMQFVPGSYSGIEQRIDADICDTNGIRIAGFLETAQKALDDWEAFLKRNGVPI